MRIKDIMNQKIYQIEQRIPVKISKKSNQDFVLNDGSKDSENVNDTSFKNILNEKIDSLDKPDSLSSNNIEELISPYLGIPYVWGGTSINGFDCSGFTQYIMKKIGVDIDRVAKDQSKDGVQVDKNNLKLGDLVFFNTVGDGVSHVGIYLNDGNFIHASSAAKKVTVSNLDSGYYNDKYVTARRVI